MNSIERYLLEISDFFQRFINTFYHSLFRSAEFITTLPDRATKRYMDARIYVSLCIILYYAFTFGRAWDADSPFKTAFKGTYDKLTAKSFGEHIFTVIPAILTIIVLAHVLIWILRPSHKYRRALLHGLLYWFADAIVLYVLFSLLFDFLFQSAIEFTSQQAFRFHKDHPYVNSILNILQSATVDYFISIYAALVACSGLRQLAKNKRKLQLRLLCVPLIVLFYSKILWKITYLWYTILLDPYPCARIISDQYSPHQLSIQSLEFNRVPRSHSGLLYHTRFTLINTSKKNYFIHKNSYIQVSNPAFEEYTPDIIPHVSASSIDFPGSEGGIKRIAPNEHLKIDAFFLMSDSVVRGIEGKHCIVDFSMPDLGESIYVPDVLAKISKNAGPIKLYSLAGAPESFISFHAATYDTKLHLSATVFIENVTDSPVSIIRGPGVNLCHGDSLLTSLLIEHWQSPHSDTLTIPARGRRWMEIATTCPRSTAAKLNQFKKLQIDIGVCSILYSSPPPLDVFAGITGTTVSDPSP
jgi:hypothetical protein